MCYGSIMICMESGRYAARGASSAGERMANSCGTAGDASPAINSKTGGLRISMTKRIPFMISQSAFHRKFCPFVNATYRSVGYCLNGSGHVSADTTAFSAKGNFSL